MIPGALAVSRHLTIFQGRFGWWSGRDKCSGAIKPSTLGVCPPRTGATKWSDAHCSQNRLTNRYSEQQILFELPFSTLILLCIDMRIWFRQNRWTYTLYESDMYLIHWYFLSLFISKVVLDRVKVIKPEANLVQDFHQQPALQLQGRVKGPSSPC